MGNQRMGNHQTWVTSTSPRMLEVAATDIWRQLTRIEVIRPLHFIIPIIRVKIVVAPTTNFVKNGILTGSITNLGCGPRGVSTGRNLSRSSRILISIIGVIGTPHMVFTNPIMTIHVNIITY